MIPPHLFYQIYLSFLEQNDCTPPKCGELSEYTDSAHTEVEDLSSRYMNGSNVYDRCRHDTRQLHPSCTAFLKMQTAYLTIVYQNSNTFGIVNSTVNYHCALAMLLNKN